MEKSKQTDPQTGQESRRLERFLLGERATGYVFASSKDERIIPDINAGIVGAASTHGKQIRVFRFDTDSKEFLLPQLERAAHDCDGLIVTNLGSYFHWAAQEPVPEDLRLASELNFAREGIVALGKPIVFWASERLLAVLGRYAQDLLSQRQMSNTYFEERYVGEEWEEQLLSSVTLWEPKQVDREALELKKEVLEGQLERAKRQRWPKKRIAAEIALPLAMVLAELGEREQGLELLSAYHKNRGSLTISQGMEWMLTFLRLGAPVPAKELIKNVMGAFEPEILEGDAAALVTKLGEHGLKAGFYAYLLSDIGLTLTVQEKVKEAELFLRVASAIFGELNRRGEISKAEVSDWGSLEINQGNIDVELGNLENARSHFEESLTMSAAVEDLQLRGLALFSLSSLDIKSGENEIAHTRLEEVVEIFLSQSESLDHVNYVIASQASAQLASLSSKKKDYEAALHFLNQAIAYAKISPKKNHISTLHMLASIALHRLSNHEEGRKMSSKALALAKAAKDTDLIEQIKTLRAVWRRKP